MCSGASRTRAALPALQPPKYVRAIFTVCLLSINRANFVYLFPDTDIVFAQFRTSGVKALLALDRPRKADQAQPAMARTVLANSAPSARANATMNASVSGVLSPLQKLKQKHGNVRVASAVDNKPSHATSSAIVDINKLGKEQFLPHPLSRLAQLLLKPLHAAGYHMLNKASRPADWQVQDPLEQDLDSAVGSPKSPKSPNNRLSAARLSALVCKVVSMGN